jgi:hypothetical protein
MAMRRFGVLETCGVLLFAGYLVFFLLRHDPNPRAVPGILAIAPQGYLQAAALLDPLRQLSLRLGIPAPAFYTAGLLLVLAYLFVVYLRVLRFARAVPRQDGRLRVILAGVLLFSLPLIFCPYLLSRDIYSYIIYGRMAALYGDNPAITAPIVYANDPYFQYLVSWKDVPSVYGPVWTLFSHGLTLAVERMGGALWLYLLAYKLAMLAVHGANTILIWRILEGWKPGRQVYGALLYAWNPLVLIEFVGSAHNDVLMLGPILLAVLCARRGYWRAAIAALIAAALVKWIAAVLIPLWALVWLSGEHTWRGRLWRASQIAAIAIAGAVLVSVPYGQVLRSIGAPMTIQSAMKAENSIGALAIRAGEEALARLGASAVRDPAWRPAAERVVGWCSKGLALLAWLIALYAVWRRPAFERLLLVSCWLLLALLLISPLFRAWYVTWPLALAALLDWRPAGRVICTLAAAAQLLQIPSQSPAWLDALVFLPAIILLAYELWRARRLEYARSAPAPAEQPLARPAREEWTRTEIG